MSPSLASAGTVSYTITTRTRRILVMARVVRAARVVRTASLAAAPGTGMISLGVTVASTVLLFAADRELEKKVERSREDCALKPGEDVLDRFIDGGRLSRSGYLNSHEGSGLGHTLKKHVVQLHELQWRLSKRFPNVSSFDGQPTAERVIRDTVFRDIGRISRWATQYTAKEHEIPFHGDSVTAIGFGLTLDVPTTPDQRHHAIVVLRQIAPPDCRIFILTAYPTRHAEERIQE